MIPDIALDSLSVEQLISALHEKLFAECTQVKSTMPPVSRAQVAMFAAEVRTVRRTEENLRFDETIYRSTPWRNEPKTFSTK